MTAAPVVRVMLVDDQQMIRAGVRVMLEACAQVQVVAEAAEGVTALHLARTTPLEVVLLDLRMPGPDGVETTRRLRREHPAATLKVLVLTTFDEDAAVLAALRAGADGFIGKGVGPTALVQAVLDVAAGRKALSPTAVDAVVGHVADPPAPPVDPDAVRLLATLTPREAEIVAAVVSGATNAEIAARLVLSTLTVKTHVNRAMTKVGARDRAQLVTLAVRAGVLP